VNRNPHRTPCLPLAFWPIVTVPREPDSLCVALHLRHLLRPDPFQHPSGLLGATRPAVPTAADRRNLWARSPGPPSSPPVGPAVLLRVPDCGWCRYWLSRLGEPQQLRRAVLARGWFIARRLRPAVRSPPRCHSRSPQETGVAATCAIPPSVGWLDRGWPGSAKKTSRLDCRRPQHPRSGRPRSGPPLPPVYPARPARHRHRHLPPRPGTPASPAPPGRVVVCAPAYTRSWAIRCVVRLGEARF